MIEISLILVAGYFAFWVYVYLLVKKVQNSLYQSFPKEAIQYLGTKKSFGINRKAGLLFLWEGKIKDLTRRDKKIEGLRQKAAICIVLLFAAMFLMPLLMLIILWLASVIRGL